MRDSRRHWAALSLACALLTALAGCSGTSSTRASATPTATLLPTSTTIPTATPPRQVFFACPTTTDGSENVFDDTSLGVRFTYPVAWTEKNCERTVSADGTQSMWIGSIFNIETYPRNGQTIQQLIASKIDAANENVTLTPMTVPGAVAAEVVQVSPIDSNKSLDGEPFQSTFALVAGSQWFYDVYRFTALWSVTDTSPPLADADLAQQVVTTFVVH